MNKLNTPCFTVQDGKIVEGTLGDFDCYIETTTRPTGVGYKYYATTVRRDVERDTGKVNDDGDAITETVKVDVWALAQWITWAGPEVIVKEFDSEAEATAAAEETYVYDILNNSEMSIHLTRAEAERELSEMDA